MSFGRKRCFGWARITLVALWILFGCGYTVFADPGNTQQDFQDQILAQEWKGDFDGMVKRHEIRVLVVYSKTFYFLDKGQQRGLTYEGVKELPVGSCSVINSDPLNNYTDTQGLL